MRRKIATPIWPFRFSSGEPVSPPPNHAARRPFNNSMVTTGKAALWKFVKTDSPALVPVSVAVVALVDAEASVVDLEVVVVDLVEAAVDLVEDLVEVVVGLQVVMAEVELAVSTEEL